MMYKMIPKTMADIEQYRRDSYNVENLLHKEKEEFLKKIGYSRSVEQYEKIRTRQFSKGFGFEVNGMLAKSEGRVVFVLAMAIKDYLDRATMVDRRFGSYFRGCKVKHELVNDVFVSYVFLEEDKNEKRQMDRKDYGVPYYGMS